MYTHSYIYFMTISIHTSLQLIHKPAYSWEWIVVIFCLLIQVVCEFALQRFKVKIHYRGKYATIGYRRIAFRVFTKFLALCNATRTYTAFQNTRIGIFTTRVVQRTKQKFPRSFPSFRSKKKCDVTREIPPQRRGT